ncbi:GTP cyclohydrolase II [Rubricella aquisinus]|uniref:GTP cyclohydrolase-2 n=1 Tax=Rubricella aquisinus TaxID=2028108 RepID=A0A840X878_9RHOB|nr:GTP cyclohydrolase II [Rubricella aquisinus]MBB5516927.1 GTP cyclohydrolase II [Rubricella aquisinus]
MAIGPTQEEQIARARAEMRMGVPVVLAAPDGSGLLALPIETLNTTRWDELRQLGAPVLVLTARRADTLRARAYDGDIARIALTGEESLTWLQATADPAADLRYPMKGPYIAQRDGDAGLHRHAVTLARRAQLLPAVLTIPLPDAGPFADENGLHLVSQATLDTYLSHWSPFEEVSAGRVPLHVAEAGRVHVFRARDGAEEHYVIEIGTPDRAAPVLTRLHSACFTGDVAGSLKCDCGPQLRAALAQMAEEGAGLLLYLNQEGRGIGLANKMRAYSLQDEGFDTVEANHRLGFEDDERNFRVGSEILQAMGVRSVRLLTNNPRKVRMMDEGGVTVAERVPLRVGQTEQNRAYLATKRDKSGHDL